MSWLSNLLAWLGRCLTKLAEVLSRRRRDNVVPLSAQTAPPQRVKEPSPRPELVRVCEQQTTARKLVDQGLVQGVLIQKKDESKSKSTPPPSQRPSIQTQIRAAKIVAAYIGVGKEQQENLLFGWQRGVWGFKRGSQPPGKLAEGDLIVIGSGFSGGAPRVNWNTWSRGKLRNVYIGRIKGAMIVNDEPFWPNEGRMPASLRYVFRLNFDPVEIRKNVRLDGQELLSTVLSEELRRSAPRGSAFICDVGELRLEGVGTT